MISDFFFANISQYARNSIAVDCLKSSEAEHISKATTTITTKSRNFSYPCVSFRGIFILSFFGWHACLIDTKHKNTYNVRKKILHFACDFYFFFIIIWMIALSICVCMYVWSFIRSFHRFLFTQAKMHRINTHRKLEVCVFFIHYFRLKLNLDIRTYICVCMFTGQAIVERSGKSERGKNARSTQFIYLFVRPLLNSEGRKRVLYNHHVRCLFNVWGYHFF